MNVHMDEANRNPDNPFRGPGVHFGEMREAGYALMINP
jgi:hypothetical protein